MHGYGDYGSRYACVGKYLSERGYEFATLDQRGFGNSQGPEGLIEKYEITTQDNINYHQKYVDTYEYLNDVPKYLMSGSFGSQIILYCHLDKPHFYQGICPGAPYFRHRDEEDHRKIMWLINLITKLFSRHYRMNFGYDTRQKPHVEHWDLDNKHLGMSISMHTILEFVRSLDNINHHDLFTKIQCHLLI